MKCLTYTDDLPDFILADFANLRRATGHYPRELFVGRLLAEMMGVRHGVWRLKSPGVWCWVGWLNPEFARGKDEFDFPE